MFPRLGYRPMAAGAYAILTDNAVGAFQYPWTERMVMHYAKRRFVFTQQPLFSWQIAKIVTNIPKLNIKKQVSFSLFAPPSMKLASAT